MNVRSTLCATLLALVGSMLAGCQGGVEGAYTLDKTEMKKSMEAEIAKLPKDQQGFGKLGLAMIDAMDMKLELKSGGKLEMTATTPSFEQGKQAKTESKTGEWRKDGETVVLKMDKEISCKAAAKKLTCESGKKGDPALVFVRS